MTDTTKIQETMAVVTADDRRIGFVRRIEQFTKLRVISFSHGCGGDHLIPLSWVCEVGREVYLNKTSAFVASNWETAEATPPGGCLPAQWPDGAVSPIPVSIAA
jgi:hypothetical protein